MSPTAYTLFDTELGTCGIAWRESASSNVNPPVVAFQLPEATVQLTEARMAEKSTAKRARSIPPRIQEVIERVKRHFKGEPQDFRDIELDLGETSRFAEHVYAAARNIPAGRVLTYGQLAEAAGHPGAARAVGQALSKNTFPLLIPCHRVLASGGHPGGFSAHGGLATKAKMLEIEGSPLGPPFTIKSSRNLK